VRYFFPYFVHRSDPCLVLHPRHKLSYFRSAGWEPQWIETAERLIRSEFKHSYASHSVTLADDVGTAGAQEDDKVRDCIVLLVLIIDNGFLNMQDDDSTNIFDHLPALAPNPATSINKLDAYLTTDIENVTDVIAWWHGHRKTYPRLSRMALDYLTIPGKFFHMFYIIDLNVLLQQRQLTWNASLAVDAYYCPMFETDSLRRRRARFFALACGAT
jgi:hypothetical protein